jgi:HK97 family phage major capsid protein
MDLKELQALIQKATDNYMAQKAENEQLQSKFNALESKHTALLADFEKIKDSANNEDVKALVDQLTELKSEMSDLRSKQRNPVTAVSDADQRKALENVARELAGSFFKSKGAAGVDLFKYVETAAAERFKALNLTNAADGGRAVAEVLSRDVIEYAREYSPILSYVGRKPEMTRNYRELVLISYPSVQEGVENVAGTAITETTTQTYNEVKSRVFKVSAKPRITDEAMYGPDINIYAALVRLLGRELAIYTAAQVLYGNGTGKNARGILSSNRVDITATTGQSWKPTVGAGARNADFFPVAKTGVSGSLGTSDKAIVDYIIDVTNRLPTEYLNGARWYMNRKTRARLEKVRDLDERPIFRTGYIDGVGVMMLNGYPVVIDDTLPDIAANSSFAIFGRLDMAYAINDGDIDKMLLDPYTVDGCTLIKTDKEYFEMVQNSDAILVCSATANAG